MSNAETTASERSESSREGPGLILRLRPRRMFLIAADYAEQQEIEKLARAISAVLDLVEEPEFAA